MDHPVEPKTRVGAFSTVVNFNFFLWGGDVASEDLSHVHVFDSSSGAWTAKQTTGTPPPGYKYGASTSIGDIMYTYGGWDRYGKDTGCLCELNTRTLVWQLLSQEGPMKKKECAMAAIKEMLVLFGGCSKSPGDLQLGPQCVEINGNYYTNVLHVYNLKTSLWSSPTMSGERPPSCSGCTLTAIDSYTLLMFGGYNGRRDVFIVDFTAMEWRKKSGNLLQAWPAGRSRHSATHLSFDEHHQMLLVIGGENMTFTGNLRTLSDLWLLDLKTWKCSEISSKSETTRRHFHNAGVIRSSPHLVEVLLYGGDRGGRIAETCVLKFERPQGGATSKQRVFLSKILNLQDLWYKGEEKRKLAAALPEEEDTDFAESALLKDYPLLPVAQSQEPANVPSGFSMEKEISVTYQGEKGSVMWKEAGLQLLFEEDKDLLSQAAIKCSVSDSEGSYARLPSKTEVVSPVFHISSSQKLNSSATLKIFHQASDVDIDQLRFLTSTDNQPPYDYQITHEGHFTSTYGEISVQHFSFFTICHLGFHYGVKGVLSYMEKTYEASLYCSSRPKQVKSGHRWNIYLSVVKNCDIFSHSVKKYIKEKHLEDVTLVSGQVLCFNCTNKSVTAHHHFDPSLATGVTLIEPSCKSLKCRDIKRYISGRPPLLEYSIHAKLLCPLELKITLEGFEEETTFTLREIHLPDPEASISAAAVTNTIDSRSQGPIFSLGNLTLLKDNPPLRLIEVLSPDWEEAADLLGMSRHRVRIIKKDHGHSAEECCRTLIDHWLYDIHGTYSYERSWKGMCDLLNDVKQGKVANQLQKFLSKKR